MDLPPEIDALLAPLDESDRRLLTLRFGLDRGEPRTLEEVAGVLGLTRDQVGELEAMAMARLRLPHPESD